MPVTAIPEGADVIVVAIIVLANIAVALIGLAVTLKSSKKTERTETKLNDFEIKHVEQHSRDAVRLNLVWRIYIEDALESTMEQGYVKRNSPLRVTPAGKQILPGAIRAQMRAAMRQAQKEGIEAPVELNAHVFDEIYPALTAIVARNEALTFRELVGIVYAHVEESALDA